MSHLIVSTINVNGARAAVRKRSQSNLGLLAWLVDTSGEAGTERQEEKERFMAALAHRMAALNAAGHRGAGRSGAGRLRRPPRRL